MGCICSSKAVSPYDFEDLVNKAGLAYVTFDTKRLKEIDEQRRFDLYTETAALSFSGTRDRDSFPLFNWMLGPELEVRQKDDEGAGVIEANSDANYEYKLEQRRKCVDRFMAMSIQDCMGKDFGAIIALKAETVSEIDNVITVEANNETFPKMRKSATNQHLIPAGHVAMEFCPSGHRGTPFCQAMQLYMSTVVNPSKDIGGKSRLPDFMNVPKNPTMMTKEELKKIGKNVNTRMMDMMGVLTKPHKKFMKDTPHIYVAVVSLAPQAQRQGYCGRMLRGINTIADQMGWASWLETAGERLQGIYKHFGYETVHTENISSKCDVDTNWQCLPIYFMIRPAKDKTIQDYLC